MMKDNSITETLPLALPPFIKVGKTLESACRKALKDFSMIEDDSSIAIALSGGKDSLTLLFLLSAISGRGFPIFKIHAIYIDQKGRCGRAKNISFLREICKKLQVNFIVKSLPHKKYSNCYDCARDRRKILFATTKELGTKKIAFGHHREDNIQTLLLNLFYKGEFSSFLPTLEMIHFGVTILRPLIYISENKIIQFAKNYGFLACCCTCTQRKKSMRKKIEMLIREIEKHFPHIRSNLALSSFVYGSKKAVKEKSSSP